MTVEKDRRKKDRRESSDKRAEKFIKFFISEDEEKRSGKDRRKSDTADS